MSIAIYVLSGLTIVFSILSVYYTRKAARLRREAMSSLFDAQLRYSRDFWGNSGKDDDLGL